MGITWRLAMLALYGCALAMPAPQHGSHTPPGDPLAVEPGWSELIASMETMHGAMASVEPSHNSDVDIVRLMLPHHQAAIDMAITQLIYGRDPQMRRLAQAIITDQQSEIALMQLWLKQRDALTSKPGPTSNSSE
jgi:uncharacterized protein (DUF305 family)